MNILIIILIICLVVLLVTTTIMKEFLCLFFGHKYSKTFEKDNGRSVFSHFICNRCHKTTDSQYDYAP
jgi:hypothetical protein